jgi:hypothetical protein
MRRLTVAAYVSCMFGVFVLGASGAPASASDCRIAYKAKPASHACEYKQRVAGKIIGNGAPVAANRKPRFASKIIGNGARADPREAAVQ